MVDKFVKGKFYCFYLLLDDEVTIKFIKVQCLEHSEHSVQFSSMGYVMRKYADCDLFELSDKEDAFCHLLQRTKSNKSKYNKKIVNKYPECFI